MKRYRYTFLNKFCPICKIAAVEDFSSGTIYGTIERTGCFCPNDECLIRFNHTIVIAERKLLTRARHILNSEEKTLMRKLDENELIKYSGVMAWWFPVGKKFYVDPGLTPELTAFWEKHRTAENTLVYMPNSHLQRLYFIVPTSALS